MFIQLCGMMTTVCLKYPSNMGVCLTPHTWLPQYVVDYQKFNREHLKKME